MVFSGICMIILILDSKLVVHGAIDGIKLCLWTVMPSLFPFFIVTPLFYNNIDRKTIRILRPLGRMCRIPSGCEGILLIGYLGGYPIGAQSIMESYSTGIFPKSTALRMLAFCNNPGPAFIFGMVSSLFNSVAAGWYLWLITILSSVFVALSIRGTCTSVNGNTSPRTTIAFPQLVTNAIKVAGNVCAWVVLFRIILTILQNRVFHGNLRMIQTILFGFLELSNGIIDISTITDPCIRFVLCAVFLCSGGLCVAMQTYSIIKELGMYTYIAGKVLQTIYGLLLSLSMTPVIFANGNVTIAVISALMCAALLAFFQVSKKSIAFSNKVLYNVGN